MVGSLFEHREQLGDDAPALVPPIWSQIHPHAQVLVDGERREDVVALGDVADAQGDEAVGFQIGDRISPQSHVAVPHRYQAEHRLQQRRLPRTIGADDPHELPFLQAEVDATEDVDSGQVAGYHVAGNE